jgi:hypothetical protein
MQGNTSCHQTLNLIKKIVNYFLLCGDYLEFLFLEHKKFTVILANQNLTNPLANAICIRYLISTTYKRENLTAKSHFDRL